MDSKQAAEEFIRRESKSDVTVAKSQLESEDSGTAGLECDYIETGEVPEFNKYEEQDSNETGEKPEFNETEIKPQNNQTNEESCTRTVTTTEFDAVHPRFRTPKKKEDIEEFQRQNDYYCDQCKLYFAPDVAALNTHFREDMMKHRPIDECFYCKGPVYAYSFNSERQIYHNCEDGN